MVHTRLFINCLFVPQCVQKYVCTCKQHVIALNRLSEEAWTILITTSLQNALFLTSNRCVSDIACHCFFVFFNFSFDVFQMSCAVPRARARPKSAMTHVVPRPKSCHPVSTFPMELYCPVSTFFLCMELHSYFKLIRISESRPVCRQETSGATHAHHAAHQVTHWISLSYSLFVCEVNLLLSQIFNLRELLSDSDKDRVKRLVSKKLHSQAFNIVTSCTVPCVLRRVTR